MKKVCTTPEERKKEKEERKWESSTAHIERRFILS